MSSPTYEGAIITNNNSQPLQLTTITSYTNNNNIQNNNNNNNNINHENNHNNNGNGIIMEQQRGHLTEHQLQIETQDRPPAIRKFHYFKHPPQPHMCIKDVTFDGQEIFINVMSWIRIAMPDQSSDPIPLYGGMRVPSSNVRSPQFIYAVMANPTILKDIKRNCSDVQDKLALIELMCDFVEAMNPGLKLIRQPEVLKDRDLAGELKDVWSAVQVKREREKESAYRSNNHERMSFGGGTVMYEHQQQYQKQQQYYQIRQEPDQKNHMQYNEATTNHQYIDGNGCINEMGDNNVNDKNAIELVDYNTIMNARNYHNTTHAVNINNKVDAICNETTTLSISNDEADKNLPSKSDMININNGENLIVNATTATLTTTIITTTTATTTPVITNSILPTTPSKIPVITKPTAAIVSNLTSINNTVSSSNKTSSPSTTSTAVTTTVSSPSLTKKEKLGSFLPNGCHNIFPFIKSKSSSSSTSNTDGNNNKGKQDKSEKSQQKDKNRSNSFKKSNKMNVNNTNNNNNTATTNSHNNEKQLNSTTQSVVTSATTITTVQTSSSSSSTSTSIMVSSNSNNKIVKNIENELLNNEMKNVQVKDEQLIIHDKSRSIKIGAIGNPSTILTEK